MTLSSSTSTYEDVAAALAMDPTDVAPSSTTSVSPASSISNTQAPARAKAKGSSSSNVSAVYRWYEVEEAFASKKREESSIAKCKLCRQQGKLERKTCVRFSKSVTSNLWRHLKENHPDVYEKHAGEKKSVQMHRVMGVKKRGRKKKAVAPTPPATVAAVLADVSMEQDVATRNKVQTQTQGDKGRSIAATHAPVKKARRESPSQLFADYPGQHQHQVTNRHAAVTAAEGTTAAPLAASFNPEKVREAMGYLCLYEMLPFELCSSHAFRNLMVECAGGAGGFIDDSNSFALFEKEIALGYVKKMAAEVKVRTVMQMKMTDFLHLMISEWRSSSFTGENEMTEVAQAASMGCCVPSSNNEVVFLALFAVGLDQEFNPFRRCLHVSSISSYHGGQSDAIVLELARDKELKKTMERVVPSRYMPEIIAVEPPCNAYQSFCSDHKLHFLESVPTLLQNIMIATINGVTISSCYCLGSEVLTETSVSGFRNRRLDKAEYVESSSAAVAAGSSDAFYGLSMVEIASSVLEELPTSLTGHTYRDLMSKVMYLVAHFKQSPRSRRVLRRLAMDQCGLSTDSYERLFVDRLRDMVISVSGICSVLSVVQDMMPTFKKYFMLHKDSESDFSKLIQLSSLSRYEWSRVRYLTVILKPFAEATAKLDGEQYVVSSLIVPSVFTLIDKLRELHPPSVGFTDESSSSGKSSSTDVMETLPEDIEALRDLALTNLSACFGHLFAAPEANWRMEKLQTFNLLWSATILDPRTRSFIIKGSLPQHEFWEIVKSEAANIAGTKVKDKESGNDLGENSISLEEDSNHLDANDGKTTDLWDDLQANLASCAQEEMLLSSAKSSLEITKSNNLLEVEVSFFQEEGRITLRASPLEWWQNMRMKYPFLARLARYVLSIPCNVKVDDNPVLCDGGLVKRAPSQMSVTDLCDLLAASMNLRTEKNSHFEAASKHMWSTV